MRILLLGPSRPQFEAYLSSTGDVVYRTEEKIGGTSPELDEVDWLVSYGCRHIIGADVISRFTRRIVNLHISFLPWNRGADPNLWSFIENTPKGVTIHFIDDGIDTGDIIVQEQVMVQLDDTLRTSYDRLCRTIEALFYRHWPDIRSGRIAGTPQPAGGSVHRLKDKRKVEHLLAQGWDTPVRELVGRLAVSCTTKRGSRCND